MARAAAAPGTRAAAARHRRRAGGHPRRYNGLCGVASPQRPAVLACVSKKLKARIIITQRLGCINMITKDSSVHWGVLKINFHLSVECSRS